MIDNKSQIKPREIAPDGTAVYCAFDKLIPVQDLKPNPRNPNVHGENQIKLLGDIIINAGWRQPITVSKRSGLIVKGHGRRLAAMLKGLKYAPVDFQDYASEEEEHADLIADNRIAELAEMDAEKLSDLLRELDGIDDFNIDLTGFDETSLLDLLGEQHSPEDIEEDEVPELESNVFSKVGDLWILGKHRLLCGDSTKEEDVARLMRGEQADLYITDPPYNVSYTGKTKDALTIENDAMADGAFRQFLIDSFTAADMNMKPGTAFYIWHSDSEGYNFRGACKDVGWDIRECLIWNKNAMVLGRQDYQWKHEPCLYGWKPGAPHHWYSDRKQTTVVDMDKPQRNGEHPTMKPLKLFAYLIQNSSKAGDVVLDSFGGSGTTIIACEKMEREARLIELDPRYVDVIVRRYIKETGDENVKVERNGKLVELNRVLEAAGTTL